MGGMNALTLKTTGHLIGLCGLLVQTVDDDKELEIDYSILPEFWRKGYTTEAALKCREYAFKNEWANSLISIIQVDNIPSQKVALYLAMAVDKSTVYRDNEVYIYRDS